MEGKGRKPKAEQIAESRDVASAAIDAFTSALKYNAADLREERSSLSDELEGLKAQLEAKNEEYNVLEKEAALHSWCHRRSHRQRHRQRHGWWHRKRQSWCHRRSQRQRRSWCQRQKPCRWLYVGYTISAKQYIRHCSVCVMFDTSALQLHKVAFI